MGQNNHNIIKIPVFSEVPGRMQSIRFSVRLRALLTLCSAKQTTLLFRMYCMPPLRVFLLCWYLEETLSSTTLELRLIGQVIPSLAASTVEDISSFIFVASCCEGSKQTTHILAKCLPTVKENHLIT